MARATQALRCFVVLEWVAVFVAVPTSLFLEGSLPPGLIAEIEARDANFSDVDFAIGMVALVAAITASVGVFRLWRPARLLYTVLTLGSVVAAPTLGHMIEHAWAAPLFEAATLASGVVLGLLWFSPASVHFDQEASWPTA